MKKQKNENEGDESNEKEEQVGKKKWKKK